MADSILDDVEALLEKELGDKQILEQIQRAAQNSEVISNFERNYVKKLTAKHFGQPPPPFENKTPEIAKPTSPDVEIPTTFASQPRETPQVLAPQKRITKSSSKNNMIMIGIGVAVLAIIIIAAVSLSGNPDSNPTNNVPNQTTSTSDTFSVNIDSSSYQRGDIISINGKSNFSFGSQVSLSILNSNNQLVWSEQINVKNNGQFNSLTFAGGTGWENTGEFTIKAESGSEIATSSFSFLG